MTAQGQEGLARYRVWNGRVNYFKVPSNGVFFQDYRGGVRSTMNLEFGATTNAEVIAWIFPIFGKIIANSERALLDVKLVWSDFKLVPYVSMDSKIRIDFTDGLKFFLKSQKGKVAVTVSSRINTEVPKMLKEAIERHVNPRLQKLKRELISKNYTNYDIDWQVRDKYFRVTVKPRSSSGVDSAVKPTQDMICVNVNVLTLIDQASKLMKGAAGINGIDFTCVSPKFNCEGSSCSLCTDVDFNLSLLGFADKFRNCLPKS
ncbi:hypothetical protein Y032_0248g88 [Ancylostoma ceylanicum]|uniref:Lipid-binding serum glycoprotein N-terminal domain-containing protein n=1 Tax=Ancylostoma ceylanicum TaxID=53326 RepID=A0A016SCK3_9BILA|nr:hypothetical protein Y032_0248g88 [Ancylostoma ceylanicum]